jgi:nitrite reductase/ring-hydroxylating ferredoxin subunit
MSTLHPVAKIEEIPVGAHKIVKVNAFGKEIEIGVFNVDGEYFAYRNVCPHAGAPVCEGKICGTTLPSPVYEYEYSQEKKVLRCPWHGWEFDLKSGAHLVDPKMKLRAFDVATAAENLEAFTVEQHEEELYVVI